MSARTLLTFEQFARLHDDGLKHQLLEGELLVLPPPKTPHTLIAENLADALRPYVKEHRLGRVHVKAGFEQYFAHGAEEVWVVYPETRKIRIHFPDGTSRTAAEELKSAALPGWSTGLSTIFD